MARFCSQSTHIDGQLADINLVSSGLDSERCRQSTIGAVQKIALSALYRPSVRPSNPDCRIPCIPCSCRNPSRHSPPTTQLRVNETAADERSAEHAPFLFHLFHLSLSIDLMPKRKRPETRGRENSAICWCPSERQARQEQDQTHKAITKTKLLDFRQAKTRSSPQWLVIRLLDNRTYCARSAFTHLELW